MQRMPDKWFDTARRRWVIRWTVIFLLLLLWGRLLAAANRQSVTFDEIIHILQGTLYWQSWSLYSVVQNPPLINALLGLPVQLLFHPNIPFTDPTWLSNDWLNISKVFMWQSNPNGLQLIWTARLVIMLLTMLLGAMVYRFAGRLFRRPAAGLLALFIFSFDPNILAHGFLATTDLGMALFLTLLVYVAWRFWVGRGRQSGVFWGVTAVALGLAFSAKFTAIILIPALYLLILYRGIVLHQSWREVARAGFVVTGWILIGALILLAMYRFQWPLLAADYRIQQEHQFAGHSAFFHGQVKVGGWWYYFPITFLIKTPLVTLILILGALVQTVRREQWRSWSLFWLLLPAASIMAAGLLSQVNIGYRYLSPILPLLFIFIGGLVGLPVRANTQVPEGSQEHLVPLWRPVLVLLLCGLGITSLSIHPHYLAYFNILVGGPANGWQWLVDSNLDWGQDIAALANYEKTHLLRSYQAAWLGTAPLSVYGVERGQPMAVWPQGKEDDLSDNFYPPAPAPGQYVISATQLQGVYLKNPARFAWFLAQTPHDRIGYSLFVYDVPATGAPVGLGLSGIGLPMIEVSDYQQAFQSNDVSPRWFDARTSFLWPGGKEVAAWTAIGDGHRPTHPLLAQFYPNGPDISGESKVDGRDWRYHLYAWPDSPLVSHLTGPVATTNLGQPTESVQGLAHHQLEGTAVFGDTFELLGYQVDGETADQSLDLLTFWRVTQPPFTDLKIFVHLLAQNGQIAAQHDALDVRPQGLQPGDELAQLHIIPLPESLPSGQYVLQIGLYRAGDFSRLTVPVKDGVIDRILGPTIRLNR